jgi:hypothetical protein
MFSYILHTAGLAWMRDCLESWRRAGSGWVLWNLRGGFAVLDSECPDVKYEQYQGHKLVREMLKLLIDDADRSLSKPQGMV